VGFYLVLNLQHIGKVILPLSKGAAQFSAQCQSANPTLIVDQLDSRQWPRQGYRGVRVTYGNLAYIIYS
jgi:hypothetical protein